MEEAGAPSAVVEVGGQVGLVPDLFVHSDIQVLLLVLCKDLHHVAVLRVASTGCVLDGKILYNQSAIWNQAKMQGGFKSGIRTFENSLSGGDRLR